MKRLLLFSLMCSTIFIFSCNSGGSDQSTTKNDSTNVDTTTKASPSQVKPDTSAVNNGNPGNAEDTTQSATPTKPKVPQLTFCDCVKKQDTLNKALMNAETSAQIKEIQKKMKALVKGPCSKFLNNQVSADQVAARKARVAACLGNK